jgi:hypothetical protein
MFLSSMCDTSSPGCVITSTFCYARDVSLGRKVDTREDEQVFELFPKKVIYVDSIQEKSHEGDPIDTLGWKVVYVNKQTKDQNERTSIRDRVGRPLHAPNGLHVFDTDMPVTHVNRACMELRDLFRIIEDGPPQRGVTRNDPRFQMRPYKRGTPNNVLFIRDPSKGQPKLSDVLMSIRSYSQPLHEFVMHYIHFCLGADERDLNGMQVQFIHYIPRGGIQAHIDSVMAFGESIGPIFTINMNKDPKAFDLLPTLLPEGTPSVRLITNLGQVTMMDAESRILWSHSIPYDNDCHCYTIAFKFPCLERYKHDKSGGYSEILDVHIPQNIAERYSTPLLHSLEIG